MAITFVNKGTWAAGTTSISPGIPASMAAGDFMILDVHTCNQAVTTPSGWTVMTSSPVSTGTANTAGGTRISSYYRWWQSGDAAPTVAVTGGTVTNGIISGYRGVDPTTPLDATPVATTLATASTTLTMTGITTATANALIHWSVARDQDLNTTTAVTAFTNANLTGITETHDQVVNTGVGGGIWCGRGFKATAGATGNTTITQTSSIAVGLTIALRPKPNDYPLTAQGGAYTLTGGSAVLKRSKLLTASGGSYSLTGASAVLTKAAASVTPVRISTTVWQQDLLGTGGTPGAKSITVPADAQAVVVQFHCGATSSSALSITSDFASTFTVIDSGNQNQCSLGYALVTSTGAKNLTLSWTQGLVEGPSVYISFIKNINTSDWVREVAVVGTDTSGTSASNVFDTSTDDLLLVVNDQDWGGAPATISGFTSIATTDDTYSQPSRLQSCNAPGATTTTVTGTTTNFDVLSGISIKPAGVVSTYTLTASGGSYSLSGSSAVVTRNRKLTSSGGSYTLTGSSANIKRDRKLTSQGGSYTLTGQSATLVKGRKLTASGGSYTVTGGTATLLRSKRLVASGGSYALTGQQAVLTWAAGAVNYTLTCLAGTYSLTGGNATLSRNRNLTASGGAYNSAGSSTILLRSKRLTANGGAYLVTGGTATLLKSKVLTALGGSYVVAGQNATVLRSKYINAQGGAYSLTGSSASYTLSSGPQAYTLTCLGGSYSILGASANLSRNRKLTASGGAYSLTGGSATILRSKYLTAQGGSYILTGQQAILSKNRVLNALGGAYVISGGSIVIQKSGIVWPLPSDVALGVNYGPTGFDYVGTMDIFGVKYDITTGQLVKPISNKVVMTL